jgi:hypothetical protein
MSCKGYNCILYYLEITDMKLYFSAILFSVLMILNNPGLAQDTINAKSDTLVFFGQLSAWGHLNSKNSEHGQLGGRFLPSVNYKIKFPKNSQLDFEGAANVVGSLSSLPFDTLVSEGSLKLYRFWGRYSTDQLEIRLGLQKINFGSASMLRPLMWFDQLDPRDPLKLTNGVWGILGRYYFLNNANLWLWCLYGNNKPRPWEIGTTNRKIPEFGGRYQHPVSNGEMALSYHFRVIDPGSLDGNIPAFDGINIPTSEGICENRVGIDGRFDTKAGLWYEAVWINKSGNIGSLTNQELFNVGTDYTFGIGNGLNVVFEQLLYSTDESPFTMKKNTLFSGLSINYPIGIVDNISSITYFDWGNKNSYNFINWNHKFRNITFYLMTYWNPDKYYLPQQGNSGNTFAGPGFQIMFVYNY